MSSDAMLFNYIKSYVTSNKYPKHIILENIKFKIEKLDEYLLKIKKKDTELDISIKKMKEEYRILQKNNDIEIENLLQTM
jgi:hypothetical protein